MTMQTEMVDTTSVVPGVKDDDVKLRWSLLPLGAVEEIVRVLDYGARHYSVDNWQVVPNAKVRYWDAAMRHLVAWRNGEKNDTESKMNHLAHAGCCILFLLAFDLGNVEERVVIQK